MRRQWQAEADSLQRSKDAAVAGLQQEKVALREQWQVAVEELRSLQAKFDDDLVARMSTLDDEKADLRRQCHEEVTRLLEEKAAEAAKTAVERLALLRTLDESSAAVEQEKAALLAEGEAQKAELQIRLTEACREQARFNEEKVALVEGHSADLAKVQETWGSAFARELQSSRSLQEKEAARLQTLVACVSERQSESERQTALLQAELAVLQQHLEPNCIETQARRHSLPAVFFKESTGSLASDGGSPTAKAGSGRLPDGEAETEPEGEAVLDTRKVVAEPGGRTCFDMWSPSLKDLKPVVPEDMEALTA